MPSTVVHVALAAIVACALLGPAFSGRALVAVLALTAFVDLDVFVGFVLVGAHRAAFHTLLFPAVLGAALAFDLYADRPSRLVARFGPHAPRVAAVAIVAVVFGAIGPDLMTNGVNVLWPLHDQFYALTGKLHLSDQRGVVQTFVEFENGEPTRKVAKGSTKEVQYYTGVDTNPDRSGEPVTRERIFPLVDSGIQLLIVLTAGVVSAVRLWDER
ncbi:metal-dependent hydrolase [Haloarchaeobius amylolyticus]|uniref:metal-dependent hydrolase n=1 Tax=Haloarchaeobius amylolyticus TaxID=1198296 RepID=UPI00226D6365|nr:metal-dependent hydrolase [Haloarchaeobius amylolyticus]